jgi:hypothetical protein
MKKPSLSLVLLGSALLSSQLVAADKPSRTYPGARPAPPAKPARPVPNLPAALGTNVVVNGGYEVNGGVGTNVFANWSVDNQAGGSGDWLVQTGTSSPLNAFPVDPPPEGTFAAMSDTTGPGSHILHQVLALPASQGVILTCRVFVSNQNPTGYFNANTLDFTVVPNQHVRIDIMDPNAPITDVGAGVLQNVFITNPGAPTTITYTAVTANLSAYAGTSVRLRIAEVDNQFFMNFGVDDCFTADTPVELTGFTIE